VLAYLVAWVIIPGEGQKSSIAENTAGKKHDAWVRLTVTRFLAHLQAATGEWIEYTAVAESVVARDSAGWLSRPGRWGRRRDGGAVR
jgi:hypothetical protein